jgi:glycerol kinase
VAKANLDAEDIAAVGVANQRETTLVWEKATGKPVYPAIVWQDRRTAALCARLRGEGAEAEVTRRTGLRLDPYFSGTKVAWILENVDGARRRAENGELLFGTVDTWLLWRFTEGAVHVSDVTNASRTLLYNIRERCWDPALLELLGVPEAMLPQVKSSSEVYGHISPRCYPAGAPLAGAAGDQQAALFGQTCFERGMAKNTYGTGCFLLMMTGAEAIASENNLLTTIAWEVGGELAYALEGSVFMGGAVVQWLRDELGLIPSAPDCDRLAGEVADNGGVFIVPAFAGLGAPHWDPYARGAVLGLTRGADRRHLCRAALEAIAFQSADVIRAMEADAGIALSELRVDGGASRSDVLLQFQADLLRQPVQRPECVETTALGAAFLAGLAVGYWSGREELAGLWRREASFEAKLEVGRLGPLWAGWTEALERAKGWAQAGEE